MAKDPAFLFYYQDFLVGTEFMSAEEVGCFVRLLCHQADKGKLTEKHILSICRAYGFSDSVREKFKVDSEGLFYNERLRFEVEKRKLYSESRRKNAKAYALHMENENTNENENKGSVRGFKAEDPNKKRVEFQNREFNEKMKAWELEKNK